MTRHCRTPTAEPTLAGAPRGDLWTARDSATPPACALAVAVGLHALWIGVLAFVPSGTSHRPTRTADATARVEVELIPPDDPFPPSTRSALGYRESPGASKPSMDRNRGQQRRGTNRTPEADRAEPLANELLTSSSPGPGEAASAPNVAGTAPQRDPGSIAPTGSSARPIDLGLDGMVRDGALLAYQKSPPAPSPQSPSPGLLKEGLDALDANHGMSRSGPAIHAGYEAARRSAPDLGSAVFDILTDDRGVVLSVSLVSSGPDRQRWQEVRSGLEATLNGRRFRVPAGAKGILTRIRIDRGKLTDSRKNREKLQRAAAIGQDVPPPTSAHGDSTHAQEDPGVISPTAGVSVGGSSAHPTLVVLVFEKAL